MEQELIEEADDLKKAITEIHLVVQELEKFPFQTCIAKETIKNYIHKIKKEEEDLTDYFDSCYGE